MQRAALARWRQRLSWVSRSPMTASAMEVDEGGKGVAGGRRRAAIEPQRDGHTGRARRRELANLGNRRRIRRQYLARREKQFARLGRAQRLVWRPSGQPHHLENPLGIAIERHNELLWQRDQLCHFKERVAPCTRPSVRADAEKPRSGKTGASAACRCAGPTGQSASLGDITMPPSKCRFSTEIAIPNRPN